MAHLMRDLPGDVLVHIMLMVDVGHGEVNKITHDLAARFDNHVSQQMSFPTGFATATCVVLQQLLCTVNAASVE